MEHIGELLKNALETVERMSANPEQFANAHDRITNVCGLPHHFGRELARVVTEAHTDEHRVRIGKAAEAAVRLLELPDLADSERMTELATNAIDGAQFILGYALSSRKLVPNLLYIAGLIEQVAKFCHNEAPEYFDSFIEFLIYAKHQTAKHRETCPFHTTKTFGTSAFLPETIRKALMKSYDEGSSTANNHGDPEVDNLVALLSEILGAPTPVVPKDGESREDAIARTIAEMQKTTGIPIDEETKEELSEIEAEEVEVQANDEDDSSK